MGTRTALLDRNRPTHVRYGVLGFACALSLVTYLDRICIMRAKEDIQGDLGFTNTQMGLVFAAFAVGYTLFEVPGGWMGDVWGSRRVLTRIVLCWSLFTALTGCVVRFTWNSGLALALGSWQVSLVVDGLVLMLAVRFLFGAGEAGAYPNLARVVGAWFPFRERAFAQGGIWMAARLGGALAPFVLGRLAALVGWRQAFWCLGLLGVAWCVAFRAWFRDSPAQHPACNAAERDLILGDAAASSLGHGWPPWRQLVGSVTLWALCVASAGVSFGWYFYPTWQPEYLKVVHGFQYAGVSELLTGLPFLCGAVGALLGGWLSDFLVRRTGSRRWGRSLLGVAGFSGAGACVLATGFATSATQAVSLLCLAFFINDLAIPAIWATCADVGGRYAGTVSGIMNMAGGVGSILSPALTPVVLAAFPPGYAPALKWRFVFAGLAGAWFVAALAWLLIDASRPLFAGDDPMKRAAGSSIPARSASEG